MTEMEINMEEKAEVFTEENIKDGWYKANYDDELRLVHIFTSTVYNKTYVDVLGAGDTIQHFYSLGTIFSLYTDWKPVEKITIEVE